MQPGMFIGAQTMTTNVRNLLILLIASTVVAAPLAVAAPQPVGGGPNASTAAPVPGKGSNQPPSVTAFPRPGEGPIFPVTEALEAMRSGHPQLSAARADIRAAAADAVAAGLWSNPQLDASYLRAVTTNPSVDSALGFAAAGYTQFLETAGAPKARREAAQWIHDAVQSDSQALERQLSVAVQRACQHLVAAATRVEVHRQSVNRLQFADGVVGARVRDGAAPQFDGSRMTIAIALARSMLGEAEADVIAAKGELRIAVGNPDYQVHGLPALDLYLSETPVAAERLVEETHSNRPDLQAARQREHAAQTQVSVAKKSILPGFGLRGGVQYGNSSGELDFTVGITVPLLVNDHGQGTIAAAVARSESAHEQMRSLDVQAEQRVRAAWDEVQRRNDAFAKFRDSGATSAQNMGDQAMAGYRGGKVSVLELVDAFTAKRDAQLRLVDLAESMQDAALRLRQAVQAGGSN